MAHTCALFKGPWGFSVEPVVVYMVISLKLNCCSAPSTGTQPHTTNTCALYSYIETRVKDPLLYIHRQNTKDYHGNQQSEFSQK